MHKYKRSSPFKREASEVINVVASILLFFAPEGEVLLQQFNDALGVTEVVLFKLVDLVKCILETLVSEVAGGLVVLHDLVMEH